MAIYKNGKKNDLKERAEAIESLIVNTSSRLGVTRNKDNRYKFKISDIK